MLLAPCAPAHGQVVPGPAGAAAELNPLNQALAAVSGDATLRFKRAVELADQGRSAEALALLRQLSEQFPDLVEPLNNQAVLLAQAGDIESARAVLEQALRLDSRHVLVRQNLGEVYLLMAQRTWEGVPEAGREAGLVRRLSQLRELLSRPR